MNLDSIERRRSVVATRRNADTWVYAEYVLLFEDIPALIARVRDLEATVKEVTDEYLDFAKAAHAAHDRLEAENLDLREALAASVRLHARAEARAKGLLEENAKLARLFEPDPDEDALEALVNRRLRDLEAENARLREALALYADRKHWDAYTPDWGLPMVAWEGEEDETNGQPWFIAQQALEGKVADDD